MKAVPIVVLALASLGVAPLRGQQGDTGARVERLADGVYAIIHHDATHEWPSGATNWPHGNTGVIIGDDGVLVVDATYYPSRARADIALIRSLTNQSVRYLVNSHWHGDHTHGNAVYREAFPGLSILGARENRRFIDLNLTKYPAGATLAGSAQRATVSELESALAGGKDSTGRALSPESKQRLSTIIRERKTELEELAAVRVAPPSLLFDDGVTLYLGRRRVEIHNWGRANSPDDVTVYLPEERVLFTGDIVVSPVPYAWQSYPVPWRDVLVGIEALPVRALVPGHGPVQHDHQYTRQVRELLEAAISRVDTAMRQGKSIVEARKVVKLDDFRARFVADDKDGPDWESSIADALVERAAACVQGYRC